MSGAKETLVRGSTGLRTELLELDTGKFLSFCREALEISPHVLEAAKKDGDISENVKYEDVQQAYKLYKEVFISRHRADLASFLRNVQENTQIPRTLPPHLVYKIIAFQPISGKTWLRYARELLGDEIDEAAVVYSNRILSTEQMRTILMNWIKQHRGLSEDTRSEISNRKREDLIQKYGVLDKMGRYKMLLLCGKKARKQANRRFGEDLKRALEDFLQKEINMGRIGYKALCHEVVKRIPEDKWVRFVRLHLNLEEEEIQRFRRRHCIFNEEQKLQIAQSARGQTVMW